MFLYILSGLLELEISLHVFHAPNNMFPYTIVHLTFCALQVVVWASMYANVYRAMHLLQLF